MRYESPCCHVPMESKDGRICPKCGCGWSKGNTKTRKRNKPGYSMREWQDPAKKESAGFDYGNNYNDPEW